MSTGKATPRGPASLTFLGPPELVEDWSAHGGATDDQLTGLLHALRRHVQEAPEGMWPLDVLKAAKTLSEGVSAYLREAGTTRRHR